MHVVSSMLSKSMSRPSAPPVTRAIQSDYVVVRASDAKTSSSQALCSKADSKLLSKPAAAPSPKTDDPAVTTDKGSGECVVTGAATPCGPTRPTILTTPSDKELIQQAMREEMTKSSRKDTALSRKHYYTINTIVLTSGTEIGIVLNNMAVGAGYNQRVGFQVRIRRATIRVVYFQTHNNAGFPAVTANTCVMRSCLKRTIVPAVAGTTEISFFTDSNPPGATVVPYSGLGVNPTTDSDVLRVLVHNPASVGTYHVYNDIVLPPMNQGHKSTEGGQTGSNNILSTGTTMQQQPRQMFFEWIHDLDFVSTYDTSVGNTGPLTNQLELTFLGVFDADFYERLHVSTDLEFEDIVTGDN